MNTKQAPLPPNGTRNRYWNVLSVEQDDTAWTAQEVTAQWAFERRHGLAKSCFYTRDAQGRKVVIR